MVCFIGPRIGYVFDFPANYLGGTAVVIAESEQAARDMLVIRLESNNIEAKGIRLVSMFDGSPSVVYFYNGDY